MVGGKMIKGRSPTLHENVHTDNGACFWAACQPSPAYLRTFGALTLKWGKDRVLLFIGSPAPEGHMALYRQTKLSGSWL